MGNYWVDERFIKRFEEMERIVGVTGSNTSVSKYNHFTDTNRDVMRVEILSIVDSPEEGDYFDGSSIQFTGRQVYKDESNGTNGSARLNFDALASPRLDTQDQFDVGNLYGIGIDFDFENPLDSEEEFVNKIFDATIKLIKIKDDSGDYTNQEVWSITPVVATSNFGLCTITALGEVSNQYKVDIQIGNPNLPFEDELPKGLLFMNYPISDPIAIGAKLMVLTYDSTEDIPEGGEATYKYDCFPIETMMNLVALPPEEPEVP